MLRANMRTEWGASVQEAQMRRVFNVALVVTGVMISVIASPDRSVAVNDVKGKAPNVAVPDNMRAFPAVLVPIP